jgi:hypothetical protein
MYVHLDFIFLHCVTTTNRIPFGLFKTPAITCEDKHKILNVLSQLLVSAPVLTAPIAQLFRPILPELVARVTDGGSRSVLGKWEVQHFEATASALSKLLHMAPHISGTVVAFFARSPSLFARLSQPLAAFDVRGRASSLARRIVHGGSLVCVLMAECWDEAGYIRRAGEDSVQILEVLINGLWHRSLGLEPLLLSPLCRSQRSAALLCSGKRFHSIEHLR